MPAGTYGMVIPGGVRSCDIVGYLRIVLNVGYCVCYLIDLLLLSVIDKVLGEENNRPIAFLR